MCGRYTLRRVSLAKAAFDALPTLPFEEFSERGRFNVAPSQDIPVVRLNAQGQRMLGLVKWGLIPHWSKARPKLQPINARAETIHSSNMFRQAFARRRCLIPADGFYEWWKVDPKTKQPMFIHLPDDELFAFAGLWERWTPPGESEPVDTCTIITTTPNELMSRIHDRMPVIVDPDDYGKWLDPKTGESELKPLLRPYHDGMLLATKVTRTVNSPKNDSSECIAPIDE